MSVNNAHVSLIKQVCQEQNKQLLNATPLSGGDINDVYKLEFKYDFQVIKINTAEKFPGMFEAEKAGLEELAAANCFVIPQVISTGVQDGHTYILLSYIESGNPKQDFWEIFGKNLAHLHLNTRAAFGFSDTNYIGSLPQYNKSHHDISTFYLAERLEPQLKLASEKGFDLKSSSNFFKNIQDLIPKEEPALLHGDLWSGNFLADKNGDPCLIDPAVSYGPREMDLAMMKLFGGFPPAVFTSYNQYFPVQPGFKERIKIWQLYYLLVHLNIFGDSYFRRCQKIISEFS